MAPLRISIEIAKNDAVNPAQLARFRPFLWVRHRPKPSGTRHLAASEVLRRASGETTSVMQSRVGWATF